MELSNVELLSNDELDHRTTNDLLLESQDLDKIETLNRNTFVIKKFSLISSSYKYIILSFIIGFIFISWLNSLLLTHMKHDRTIVMISLDGFGGNMFDKQPHECINYLIDIYNTNGQRAEYMLNAFPTKTFPNHYTMVTGLWEESHGIINNEMYDPLYNEIFNLGSNTSYLTHWWSDGEPIWVTAEKNNKTTAVMFWPGSEVEINQIKPTYLRSYNESISFNQRMDQIIQWLLIDKKEQKNQS